MTVVHVVHHLREDPDGFDDVKLIGVYSSMERAQQSVIDHRKLPGFSLNPEGFSIDEYEIDKDEWIEGFADCSA